MKRNFRNLKIDEILFDYPAQIECSESKLVVYNLGKIEVCECCQKLSELIGYDLKKTEAYQQCRITKSSQQTIEFPTEKKEYQEAKKRMMEHFKKSPYSEGYKWN